MIRGPVSTVRPLLLRTAARPDDIGPTRRGVRRWLGEVLDDPDVVEDLVLAVSEALENAVDHAYVGRTGPPGTVAVEARLEDATVVVVVVDDGRWQEPAAGPTSRGRGIALMETLADSAVVETAATGTSVTLTHRR